MLSISFAVTAAYLSYFTFIQPPVVQEEAPFPFRGCRFPAGSFTLFGLLLRQELRALLALLERYRHAVYAAAAVTGCFIVAVSYFGQDIAVTSKRPDILLYSTSIISYASTCFKLKSVPKLIMMISNYSFLFIYCTLYPDFGLVILTALDSIGTVSAVLLCFHFYRRCGFISWAVNKLKYGYMFVGKFMCRKEANGAKVRHHAG
ncbi:hypothetical protein PO124_02445 [Bacillus licheniformis]|nr:hypothetical protein [Bacillus licheniformis]